MAVTVVASLEREIEKTKKTERKVMIIKMMMTRNIAEEYGRVIVMTIESLIGEKTEVNMILKGAMTETDVKGEDVEVKMIGIMMKKLILRDTEKNIDLKEEDGISLQMMRGTTTPALKTKWRKMTDRTATKE